MDALDFLIADHVAHRSLLNLSEERADHFPKLRSELIHHIDMEERVLYPLLLEVGLLEEEVRNAWEEHKIIMQLLQEMDGLLVQDERWLAKFHALKKILLSHLEEEEGILFPRIRKTFSPDLLQDLSLQLFQQRNSHHSDEILYPKVPHSHEEPPV